MKTFTELKKAIRNNLTLVFKDGEEFQEIEYLEEITKEFDELTPITATYNGGESEAEIFLNEIYLKSEIEEIKPKIENFLKSIEVENLEILDFINIDEIDHSDAFESIFEMINDNGGFNIDIIYYSNSIEYLRRHDNSLNESIEIAIEYGYTIENLNSELLASLLASKNVMIDFVDYREEIENFFNTL